MFIIRAEGPYGEEFYGKGETIEDAIEQLDSICDSYWELEFYKAESIKVEKAVKYIIVD